MKIAIHHRPGSFSDGWIAACEEMGQPYKLVDCRAEGLFAALDDVDALMWHWVHGDGNAPQFAPQLIRAIEATGKPVFPSFDTCWHYDDKIAQAYLMRALGIPTPATHVFHRKDEAAEWARDAVYPLIFKLRGGSASSNIHFVRDASQARRIIDRMFAAGMRDRGAVQAFRDGLGGASGGRDLARLGGKVLRRLAAAPRRITGARERDYAYFQEFIPGLDFDIRAVVVGERCWAFRRAVREGDFRASGSKRFIHDPESIPEECIRLAFDVARRLGTQSLALDILLREGEPLVLEFSYAFSLVGYKGCDGYWTPDMGWVARRPQPERFMLEDLIGLVATTERRGG